MIRLVAFITAWATLASTALGPVGVWRCANGAACDFAGGGSCCPKRAARTGAAAPIIQVLPACCAHGACAHGACAPVRSCCSARSSCGPRPKTTHGAPAFDSSGCRCHFESGQLSAPAVFAHGPRMVASGTASCNLALVASAVQVVNRAAPITIFATGPPTIRRSRHVSPSPSRAPPLSAC